MWSNNGLLKINDDKCVQMTISHAKSDHTAIIDWLYGKQLKKVEEEKDLAVTIDSKLSTRAYLRREERPAE